MFLRNKSLLVNINLWVKHLPDMLSHPQRCFVMCCPVCVIYIVNNFIITV